MFRRRRRVTIVLQDTIHRVPLMRLPENRHGKGDSEALFRLASPNNGGGGTHRSFSRVTTFAASTLTH
jgi:hypothetical protein